PWLLVVDRPRAEHRELLVGLGHRADVVERLLVLLAGEHLPHGLLRPAHTAIPSSRIRARASSRIRSLVQTGSQTTSIRTSSTSGSASSASRMSSWMKSMAGQPIVVYVSSTCAVRTDGSYANET